MSETRTGRDCYCKGTAYQLCHIPKPEYNLPESPRKIAPRSRVFWSSQVSGFGGCYKNHSYRVLYCWVGVAKIPLVQSSRVFAATYNMKASQNERRDPPGSCWTSAGSLHQFWDNSNPDSQASIVNPTHQVPKNFKS